MASQEVKPVWERRYEAEERVVRYRGVADLNAVELVLGITSYKKTGDRLESELWIWRVRKDSGELSRIGVHWTGEGRPEAGPSVLPTDIRAVTAVSNHVIAVLDAGPDGQWLLDMEPDGRVLKARQIATGNERVAIQKIAPGVPRGIAIAGISEGNAFVERVDDSGEILWKKTRGAAGAIDIVASARGETLLVGNPGIGTDIGRRASEIWAELLDDHGSVLAGARISGRRGRACRSGNGFALVYDKGTSEGQDIWLIELDNRLSQMRTMQVTKSGEGVADFKVVSTPEGGYVVAGAKDYRPYIRRVGPRGDTAWDFWGENMPAGVEFDAIASGKAVYVVYPRLDEDKAVVRCFKLAG